jgi:predicted ATPase/class 3 adenylate cyclase
VTERALPTGTITFLFSDIEGSTRLVERVGPAAFATMLDLHNQVLREAFTRQGGTERGTQGDSFLVMFEEAPRAVAAAADAQRALAAAAWPGSAPVRVRMGLHTGIGTLGGDDYVGVDVNRAARIAAAAHGGQVLLSEATHALAAGDLPSGTSLRRLGEFKLRDLAHPERISQLVIGGLPADFPPITGTGVTGAGNLPASASPLIGREEQLRQLDILLRDRRLVTLTGPGGIGKTSLALEVARRHADRYAHGAWLVPLDGVPDPELVAPAIAAALGLVETPGQSSVDRLGAYLADRSILLVLDNLEHLMPAAMTIGQLLEGAAGVTVITTSRAPLRLALEQEFPVPPLDAPAAGASAGDAALTSAVQLFVERARRTRPDYVLGEDAGPVAEICRQLEGLPLGIQLAASRISLLPARSIAMRLVDRRSLPGAAARDVPERQRTMEGAIAWSEQLLDADGRALLARLAVFHDGFRLEEAESVAAPAGDGPEVLEGLSVLVEQSLVQPIPGPDGLRYRLLEPIRAYASNRLAQRAERDELERRHALAYLDLVETAAPHMPGGGQRPWLDRLAAEQANLRAALAWAIDHAELELAMRLGTASWRFWQLHGHVEEGRTAMDRVLAMPGAEETTPLRARAVEAAAGLHYWSADLTGADAMYREQLAMGRALGARAIIADALFNLGHTVWLLTSDDDEADQLADEATLLYTELGDELGTERVQWTRLNRRVVDGDWDVEPRMLAALARFKELGDEWYASLVQATLAFVAATAGDLPNAIRWGASAIASDHAMGDVSGQTISLRYVAVMAHLLGMREEAVTVAAAYDALCSRYGVQPPAHLEELVPALAGQALMIDADAHPEAAARGAAMSLDEVVDFIMRDIVEPVLRPG